MKILTYDTGTGPRCGILQDDLVVNVTALLGTDYILRDIRALLELGESPIDQLGQALMSNVAAPAIPLADVHLRSPILQPPTIRDFMAYEEHATSQGTRKCADAWYRMPVFYFSNPLRIFGPEDQVPYPSTSERLDYELEIGCVIGREGSNIPATDALAYIAGFCIFNDWSFRGLQRDEMAGRPRPSQGQELSLFPWPLPGWLPQTKWLRTFAAVDYTSIARPKSTMSSGCETVTGEFPIIPGNLL